MYQGRFAPSPSGRLHGGSMLTGLAAHLRAKSSQGLCLTRIEDLDFPRCDPSLTPLMLQELTLLGLFSPQDQLAIQSHELVVYRDAINKLYQHHKAYLCNCTRAELKIRPCNCQNKHIQPKSLQHMQSEHLDMSTFDMPLSGADISIADVSLTATDLSVDDVPLSRADILLSRANISLAASQDRLAIRTELQHYLNQARFQSFDDELSGKITLPADYHPVSSLVIQRSDGIISYNLAVVLDDHRQGITEIVRGADLLDTTFLQLALYEIFGYIPPKFLHVPLIKDEQGRKLSKQNRAPAILGQLLPHQAVKQAALQLQQPLSPEFEQLYQKQEQLVAYAFNQLGDLLPRLYGAWYPSGLDRRLCLPWQHESVRTLYVSYFLACLLYPMAAQLRQCINQSGSHSIKVASDNHFKYNLEDNLEDNLKGHLENTAINPIRAIHPSDKCDHCLKDNLSPSVGVNLDYVPQSACSHDKTTGSLDNSLQRRRLVEQQPTLLELDGLLKLTVPLAHTRDSRSPQATQKAYQATQKSPQVVQSSHQVAQNSLLYTQLPPAIWDELQEFCIQIAPYLETQQKLINALATHFDIQKIPKCHLK